jgi:hypothetical protein
LPAALTLGATLRIDKIAITYVSGDASGDTVEVVNAN